MAHRVQRDTHNMLTPWVAPLQEKSDETTESLRSIDMIPNLGHLRGTFWTQIVRLQSDNEWT
eukprot:1340784-Prorocentrum_lima.AAC.1